MFSVRIFSTFTSHRFSQNITIFKASKMHNVIQELRGNVRVFARVRPFLPGDGDRYNQKKPFRSGHSGGADRDDNDGGSSGAFTCPSPVVKCAGGIESTKLVVDKPVSNAGAGADAQDSGSSSSESLTLIWAPALPTLVNVMLTPP